MDIGEQIEAYLLARRDWVPDDELCRAFSIRERQLRALNGIPGLCSRFAISSDKGLKHVMLASTTEWINFKHRLRRHGIGELMRVRDLESARHGATRMTRRPEMVIEKDTGQGLFF